MKSSRAARALSPLSLALLISQAAIVVTGGAVRLTGSGLGCPTWPECTPGSYIPIKNQAEGAVHSWIEFTNRLLTFVMVAIAIAVLIAVLKAGRKDLRILALGQFLGIFGQGVLGGIEAAWRGARGRGVCHRGGASERGATPRLENRAS